MRNLALFLKKELDKFIKSSVEDLVPIPSESEDTSESNSDCDLPSCDDFSPINSLSDEDVPEDNVKIYSNPLFEFDDEYISSDVNPLFVEVLENIENKDSYVSNLDKPALLVTPLSDFNEDECFNPGGDVDEIEFLLHRDPSTPKISVKIVYDAPIDDLMTKDKIFNPGGDIDEIDAFLDIDISMDIKDSYYDSEGDILYLESLLSDDTTPSPPPELFLDCDPRSLRDINGIHEKKISPTY
ncbi:hypothetical protein Tco_1538068, partial [Tanacetum coccineum]